MRKFRPLPLYLSQRRYLAREQEFARFYGSYVNMTGHTKRFSFQVTLSPSLSNRDKYDCIRTAVTELRNKRIPQHEQGQVFHSFHALFSTTWLRVRRLRQYHAGVVYER